MKTKIIKDPTFTYYSKGGNVEKAIPGRGDGEAKKQLADLEKIEFDVFQNLTAQLQEDFENEKQPGESFIDWLKTKPNYFKRIELNKGGKVISITDYLKQKNLYQLRRLILLVTSHLEKL